MAITEKGRDLETTTFTGVTTQQWKEFRKFVQQADQEDANILGFNHPLIIEDLDNTGNWADYYPQKQELTINTPILHQWFDEKLISEYFDIMNVIVHELLSEMKKAWAE